MGTKNDPGRFDCYERAEPDEPLFTLLARDPVAPFLVLLWTALRAHEFVEADELVEEHLGTVADLARRKPPIDLDQAEEAVATSRAMRDWYRRRRRGQ